MTNTTTYEVTVGTAATEGAEMVFQTYSYDSLESFLRAGQQTARYYDSFGQVSVDITKVTIEDEPEADAYDPFEAEPVPNDLEETNGLLRRLITAVESLTGRR